MNHNALDQFVFQFDHLDMYKQHVDIGYTPPMLSEISKKNWRAKLKPFFTHHYNMYLQRCPTYTMVAVDHGREGLCLICTCPHKQLP